MSETLLILRNARDSWRDVLNGEVIYDDVPVNPNLAEWSAEHITYCTVCLAGAYYLQRHGQMLTESTVSQMFADSTVSQIELALDAIRHGRALAQLNSQSIPGPSHFLDEVLSVWPVGKFEYISTDSKGDHKVLELLNMLIDILQTNQLQIVETQQTQGTQNHV
jgi:hypothetical protein